ncbi:hypothetical protein E3N88_19992 [Mikania micrantha]|uniref:Uncharacterized protein n=1 Tax=Mikania micrantha TaxID=192012 RepID=A0A5N6NHH2_9ASTR|nr:hypothetical protein E3N88_19992 [Mikania micrantha]
MAINRKNQKIKLVVDLECGDQLRLSSERLAIKSLSRFKNTSKSPILLDCDGTFEMTSQGEEEENITLKGKGNLKRKKLKHEDGGVKPKKKDSKRERGEKSSNMELWYPIKNRCSPIQLTKLLYVASFSCEDMSVDHSIPTIEFWTLDRLHQRQTLEIASVGFGRGKFIGLSSVEGESSKINNEEELKKMELLVIQDLEKKDTIDERIFDICVELNARRQRFIDCETDEEETPEDEIRLEDKNQGLEGKNDVLEAEHQSLKEELNLQQGPNEANNPPNDIGGPIHKIDEPCNRSSPAKHEPHLARQGPQLTRNGTQQAGRGSNRPCTGHMKPGKGHYRTDNSTRQLVVRDSRRGPHGPILQAQQPNKQEPNPFHHSPTHQTARPSNTFDDIPNVNSKQTKKSGAHTQISLWPNEHQPKGATKHQQNKITPSQKHRMPQQPPLVQNSPDPDPKYKAEPIHTTATPSITKHKPTKPIRNMFSICQHNHPTKPDHGQPQTSSIMQTQNSSIMQPLGVSIEKNEVIDVRSSPIPKEKHRGISECSNSWQYNTESIRTKFQSWYDSRSCGTSANFPREQSEGKSERVNASQPSFSLGMTQEGVQPLPIGQNIIQQQGSESLHQYDGNLDECDATRKTKRLKFVSRDCKSPFLQREVVIKNRYTREEKAVWNLIFGGDKETKEKQKVVWLSTAKETCYCSIIISIPPCLFPRLTARDSAIGGVVTKDDVNDDLCLVTLNKMMLHAVGGIKEVQDLKPYDLAFFPILERKHFYAVVFELKNPAIYLLNNMQQGETVVTMKDDKGYSLKSIPYKVSCLWEATKKTFECGFKKDKAKQKNLIIALRKKYASRILLSNVNVQKVRVLKEAGLKCME